MHETKHFHHLQFLASVSRSSSYFTGLLSPNASRFDCPWVFLFCFVLNASTSVDNSSIHVPIVFFPGQVCAKNGAVSRRRATTRRQQEGEDATCHNAGGEWGSCGARPGLPLTPGRVPGPSWLPLGEDLAVTGPPFQKAEAPPPSHRPPRTARTPAGCPALFRALVPTNAA